MQCRDGTRLVSRLWQPGGKGPWPVLLMRQPYGRAIASTPTYAHPAITAAQGFVVVVQDVRGQGDSEGEFAGFGQEARDTADTLRWVRHLPQSNGRVGCYGFSYQGFTPLVSDADGPDGWPDCLAVAMTGLEERNHWACSSGAHWWALGLAWGLQMAALACRRRDDRRGWQEIRRSLADGSFLEDGPDLLKRHDPRGMAWRWFQSDPDQNEPWPCHAPSPALEHRPILLVGGWHDPHLEGTLALWHRARGGGGQPELRIGAWTHLNWQDGIDAVQLSFFRRHLQASNDAQPMGVPQTGHWQDRLHHIQNERTGAWHPLEDCLEGSRRWWLGGGGPNNGDRQPDRVLNATDSGPFLWLVHDPWRPVPGRGGHLGLDAGCCDRADLDQRRDVACFTSAPIEQNLRLAARPWLWLQVSADQPGFDLCVALSRIEADGRVRQLCTGVHRYRGNTCLRQEWRWVVMQPLLLELRQGERLRLSLAGAAWPQIAVNPGTGEQAWGNSDLHHRVITLELNLEQARLDLEPLTEVLRNPGANCGELLPAP